MILSRRRAASRAAEQYRAAADAYAEVARAAEAPPGEPAQDAGAPPPAPAGTGTGRSAARPREARRTPR